MAAELDSSDPIEIRPRGPLQASLRPPGSKSITNRALVCAALAKGPSRLDGVLDSEDTQVMMQSLQQLGFQVVHDAQAASVEVVGGGGSLPAHVADLYVANSGTTLRFLTAVVTLGQGQFRLDGVPRMRERPVADLLEALNQLGADCRSESGNGCPPVRVEARGLPGGRAVVRGSISSQFLSGLLLAAPCAQRDVELEIDGPLVSQPYVSMTLAVMSAFAAGVDTDQFRRFRIPAGGGYRGCHYMVEPDASAASYFWAAAAICGGQVTVEGLGRDSLQGDVAFCNCLAEMGCRVEQSEQGITVHGGSLQGIDVDMNAISDTAQTLAAVALFARGSTRIRGVGHIRHKETDRIADLARELRKLGSDVEEFADGIKITPRKLHGAQLDTYDDHRMAMSLALAGLRVPHVVIKDPGCTRKTYPNFFADLQSLA